MVLWCSSAAPTSFPHSVVILLFRATRRFISALATLKVPYRPRDLTGLESFRFCFPGYEKLDAGSRHAGNILRLDAALFDPENVEESRIPPGYRASN